MVNLFVLSQIERYMCQFHFISLEGQLNQEFKTVSCSAGTRCFSLSILAPCWKILFFMAEHRLSREIQAGNCDTKKQDAHKIILSWATLSYRYPPKRLFLSHFRSLFSFFENTQAKVVNLLFFFQQSYCFSAKINGSKNP